MTETVCEVIGCLELDAVVGVAKLDELLLFIQYPIILRCFYSTLGSSLALKHCILRCDLLHIDAFEEGSSCGVVVVGAGACGRWNTYLKVVIVDLEVVEV